HFTRVEAIQRLVRSVVIIDFAEFIESFLLLQKVISRRLRGLFFQGQMQAFMAAVLLRPAGLDAFDGNSQTQPPYRKLAQTKQGMGTRKRQTVIGADSRGEPKLLKDALKHVEGRKLLSRFESFATQQIPRSIIGDGQGIAIQLVAESEFAFVVGTP